MWQIVNRIEFLLKFEKRKKAFFFFICMESLKCLFHTCTFCAFNETVHVLISFFGGHKQYLFFLIFLSEISPVEFETVCGQQNRWHSIKTNHYFRSLFCFALDVNTKKPICYDTNLLYV